MPVIPPLAAIPDPAPSEVPCDWPINTGCCPDWATYDPDVQADATAWATAILWALTGRRFGPCTITVRPCGSTCGAAGGWMTWPVRGGSGWGGGFLQPYIRSGVWFNCGCTGGCSCRATAEVWLPGPVASVSAVHVDGALLAPTAYRVDNQNTLVRTDGGSWPECQDMDLTEPLGNPDTFFVTYQRGTPVPPAGKIAAGMLACSFAKNCTTSCGLPGNLSSLTRQGVEVQMVDPTEVLGAGLTGIADVDLWIRTVNPHGLAQRPTVWSPDIAPPRMVI